VEPDHNRNLPPKCSSVFHPYRVAGGLGLEARRSGGEARSPCRASGPSRNQHHERTANRHGNGIIGWRSQPSTRNVA
jgi:hypothetical protein